MTDPMGDTGWPVSPDGATQPPDDTLVDPEIPRPPPTGFRDSSGGAGTAIPGTPDGGDATDLTAEGLAAAGVAVGLAVAATSAAAAAPVAAAAAAAAYVLATAGAGTAPEDEREQAPFSDEGGGDPEDEG